MFRTADLDMDILDIHRCLRFKVLFRRMDGDAIEVFCTKLPSANVQDELMLLSGRSTLNFRVLNGAEKESFENALRQLESVGHLTPTHQGASSRCPDCGSRNVKKILYGLVSGDPEDLQENCHLGGCRLSPGSPDLRCSDCGYEWKQ